MAICAMLVLGSCQEQIGDENETSLDHLISIGKAYLVDGNGVSAADAFDSARKIDAASTDAQFGLMLANVMQFTNLVDELLMILGEADFNQSGQQDGGKSVPAKSGGLNEILHDLFNDAILTKIVQTEIQYLDLTTGGEFSFQLDRYVLGISGITLVDFAGEFDKADAHFIGALNASIYGIMNLVFAHNLNFDIENLSPPSWNPEAALVGALAPWVDLLESLLTSTSYPEFLVLLQEGGAAKMQHAGVDFGNMFSRLNLCFRQMGQETDSQQDDQVRYRDANNNGQYNEQTDAVLIGKTLALSPSETAGVMDFCENMAAVFHDGSLLDENPDFPDLLTPATFNGLLTGFGVLPIPVGDPAAPWFYFDELPAWPGVEVGYFFAYPEPAGLRSLLFETIDLWRFLEQWL
jgi:hypothetical protein